MAIAEQMAELFTGLKALEDIATNNKLPSSPTGESRIGKAVKERRKEIIEEKAAI